MQRSFTKLKLKILLLEDNNVDAEIVQHLSKTAGLDFEMCQVMHKPEFLAALEDFRPDIILCDNDLPQFSALEALEITNKRSSHIPFILVTGTVNEEFAVKIIKAGADDYILKDRLGRLPASIHASMEIRKVKKEIADYKFALDQSAIVSIANKKGKITYVNDNFCSISKFSKEELLGQDHRILNSGYHSKEFFKELWATIGTGLIWRGEFCNLTKDGNIYWVDATIVPFLDAKGKPLQYLGIRNEITDKKRLEGEIALQRIQEQKKITRAVLKAGEKERDFLGKELHDNINQILVGAKLHLSIVPSKDEKMRELIRYPLELLELSVKEIRLLSHRMVSPGPDKTLKEQVLVLLQTIHHPGIKTSFTCTVVDKALTNELRLNIYRIMQELISNILKYAEATQLNIIIKTHSEAINILVKDNGKGFDVSKKVSGIGLSNIKNRVESFNGNFVISSKPGNGTSVHIVIPL